MTTQDRSPDWLLFVLILLCMVFARSAAMAFNRYLDRDIDAKNPRTAQREIPAGVIAPRAALLFVVINALLFIATTYFINTLCFLLSPVALLVILGYSYTKRFTYLAHFVLGLGLSLAPVGAYLAVTGKFAVVPILYGLIVLFWVAGFDIMYALQDEEFDREMALNSVPVRLGRRRSLFLSRSLHIISATLLLLATLQVAELHRFGIFQAVGFGVFIALLLYQHTLVRVNDLSRINLAFFTTNGIASVLYGLFFITDFFL